MFIYACMYLSGCIMTWFCISFPPLVLTFWFFSICVYTPWYFGIVVFFIYSIRLERKFFFSHLHFHIFYDASARRMQVQLEISCLRLFHSFLAQWKHRAAHDASSSGSKIIYCISRTSSRLPFVWGELAGKFSCCFVLMIIYWMRLTTTSNLRDVATESVLAEKPATTIFFLKWKLFSKTFLDFFPASFLGSFESLAFAADKGKIICSPMIYHRNCFIFNSFVGFNWK